MKLHIIMIWFISACETTGRKLVLCILCVREILFTRISEWISLELQPLKNSCYNFHTSFSSRIRFALELNWEKIFFVHCGCQLTCENLTDTRTHSSAKIIDDPCCKPGMWVWTRAGSAQLLHLSLTLSLIR